MRSDPLRPIVASFPDPAPPRPPLPNASAALVFIREADFEVGDLHALLAPFVEVRILDVRKNAAAQTEGDEEEGQDEGEESYGLFRRINPQVPNVKIIISRLHYVNETEATRPLGTTYRDRWT